MIFFQSPFFCSPMVSQAPPSKRSLGAALIIAALLGAVCGISSAVWPVCLENGQALSGLIPFVRESTWNIYLFRLWSLINQFTGALLWLGFDGATVSILMCALMGVLSFTALAALILALGGSSPIAALSPLLIYVCELKGWGFSYPIDLMRTPHVFGIIGFSYTLLTLGFWGNRLDRTTMFLAGLAPAVHPSWGAFCLVTIAAGAVLDAEARKRIHRALIPLCLGAAGTGASFLLQRHLGAAAFVAAAPVDMNVYQLFLRSHDVHRLRFEPQALDVFFFFFTIIGLSLALWKRILPQEGAVLGKSVLASVAAAGCLTIAARLLPDFLPLQMLMPPRFFNLAIILAAPVFFALTTSHSCRPAGLILTLLFATAVLLAGANDALRVGIIMTIFPLSLILLFTSGKDKPDNWLARSTTCLKRIMQQLCTPVIIVLLVLNLFVYSYYSVYTIKSRFHDSSNDSFFALCSSRPGSFLPSVGIPYPQWHILRPVIFFPAGLDMASYFPDLLPSMCRLAMDVYGEDILVPRQGPQTSSLSPAHRALWEERSENEWRKLGTRYGFTDILTPSDWKLHLPLVDSNCDYALYALP